METPVFEEFDPKSGCDCPGCARRRRVILPTSAGRRTRRPVTRKAFALAAATGAVLGMTQATPAVAAPYAPLEPPVPAGEQPPDTPQGKTAPLHGPVGGMKESAVRTTTRADIINRARKWVKAKVPYSMNSYWSDGYRQDCSGFVSMAWNLGSNEWTGSLNKFGVRITKDKLQPGDMLLFHNPDNPERGSHVVLFGGWTDYTHTSYIAYEETPPAARRQVTPYAYWTYSDRYVPYRYKNIVETKAGAQDKDVPVPGLDGSGVPGLPGPQDWSHLVPGRGANVPAAMAPGRPSARALDRPSARTLDRPLDRPSARTIDLPPAGAVGPRDASSQGVPGFPGPDVFRPGVDNPHVTLLGRQLISKGFGAHYTDGPGSRWGEADRRSVEAFQRAQGWRGTAADGYPGPETWRRLFS